MIYQLENDLYVVHIDLSPLEPSGRLELSHIESVGTNENELVQNARVWALDDRGERYETELDEWMLDLIAKDWLNYHKSKAV